MAPWTPRVSSNPRPTAHDGISNPEARDNLPLRRQPGHGLDVPSSSPPAASLSACPPPRSHRSHSRSISNPFPSLFGGKRNTSQRNGPEPDAAEDEDSLYSGLSRSLSPHKQPSRSPSSEDHITRRCMTCDHTNSFPRGKKGFRCGKCTTMNDLVSCHESLSLQVPSRGPDMHSKARIDGILSVARTRAIINQCVNSYLLYQLGGREQRDISRSGRSPPPQRHDEPAPLHDHGQGHLDTSPVRSKLPSSDHGGELPSNLHSSIHANNEASPSPHRQRSSEQPLTLDPALHQSRHRPHSEEDEAGVDRHATIFGLLERYIVSQFDGCDTLNNSFLTVRPRHARTASEGGQPAFEGREGTIHSALGDAPVSQLDEKTLRLGDIAENGTWWTGDRPTRHKSTDDRTQKSNLDAKGSLVSLRSPRINWFELGEWYQLVIHAGESWFDNWAKMRPLESEDPETLALIKRWDSIKLSMLNQKIHESRLHLRMTLLRATEKLLQRPKRPLSRPEEIRFILILLENPLLYPASGHSKDMATAPRPDGRSKSEDDGVGNRGSPVRSLPSSMPVNDRTDHRTLILKRAMGLLSNLPNECHHLLLSWFSRFSESHFRRLVELVGGFVSHRLTRQRKRRPRKATKPGDNDIDEFVPTFSSSGNTTPAQLHTALHREKSSKATNTDERTIHYGEDWQVKAAARVMALLFRANYMSHNQRSDPSLPRDGSQTSYARHTYLARIPISSFYSTILDYSDIVADFEAWESRSGKFAFCQYSFFLSIWAKIRILEHDARRQMEAKAREAFFDSILGRSGVSQYLVLKVRRDCLVEDSLRGVSGVVGSAQQEIKKGLRIEFNGEEGVDAGGIRKEWFLLLTREIFDPNHGLFIYDDDSQYCYFNPYCFESSEQFFLVGVLLGLAIYNSTILDIALPPFAFRKLLASSPSNSGLPTMSTPPQPFRCTLEDLAEYRPALAKGLRQLLEYEGEVEETFCQSFVAHQERYGHAVEVLLCPGGENRPVTSSNRREFVDLYVKYVLDEAVSRQFEPFKRGFFTVCGGNALYLFRPEEIELLVRGSDEPLDIPSIRAVAIYEHWPVTDPDKEPIVNWFWEFFAALPPKNQRKLLSFITGSDRVPAMGATNLIIRLVCLGQDSDRFPTARTCFNMVALYRYRSREKLENKLWRAVSESEGFGLK